LEGGVLPPPSGTARSDVGQIEVLYAGDNVSQKTGFKKGSLFYFQKNIIIIAIMV
jgi:hypothetical protein